MPGWPPDYSWSGRGAALRRALRVVPSRARGRSGRMKRPIRLALIWHFHQPDYTDSVTRGADDALDAAFTRSRTTRTWPRTSARHPGDPRDASTSCPTLLDQLQRARRRTQLPAGPVSRPGAEGRGGPDASRSGAFVVGHFFSLSRDMMAVALPALERSFAALRGDARPRRSGSDRWSERFDDQALPRPAGASSTSAWSGPLLQSDPLMLRARQWQGAARRTTSIALFARPPGVPGRRRSARWQAPATTRSRSSCR